MTRSICLAAAVALVACAATLGAADPPAATSPAPAAAQLSAPLPPALPGAGAGAEVSAATLADLDSDRYEVRERASLALLADDRLTPQAIFRAYARAPSPEQRHRLLEVARHHFVRVLREKMSAVPGPGSLGVQILGRTAADDPQLQAPAVAVTGVLPGFPSYALLRPGDLILAIGGQRFTDADNPQALAGQLRQMVMQAQSGQTVTLTLSRAGTTLQVPCKLANMAALEALYPPRPGQGNAELAPPFAAAWEKYAQALASAAPGAAAPDVDWDQLVPASP